MDIAGYTGVEAGSQCVLFKYQLSPLWPNNENLVMKGFWCWGFLGGEGRHKLDGIAAASVTPDRIEYLGYQMTLVTVWRTSADAERQKYKLLPHT